MNKKDEQAKRKQQYAKAYKVAEKKITLDNAEETLHTLHYNRRKSQVLYIERLKTELWELEREYRWFAGTGEEAQKVLNWCYKVKKKEKNNG